MSATANQMKLLDWYDQNPGSTAMEAARAMHVSPTSANDWSLALVTLGRLRWEGSRPRRYWLNESPAGTVASINGTVVEYLESENRKQAREIVRLRDEVRSLRATLATPGRLVPVRRT